MAKEGLLAARADLDDIARDVFIDTPDRFSERLGKLQASIAEIRDAIPATRGPISCANCSWRGTVEQTDLPPDEEYRARIGLADDYLNGIALMPSGQCPECGCFAYRDAHRETFDRITALLQQPSGNAEA